MNKKNIAIFGAIIIVVITLFFYTKPQTSNMASDVMLPTFKKGDKVKVTPIYGELRIGDIVVYKKTANSEQKAMHRIIAVAGDTISFNALDGLFKVNDAMPNIQNVGNYFGEGGHSYDAIKVTNNNGSTYTMIENPSDTHYVYGVAKNFRADSPSTNGDQCNFTDTSFSCAVPKKYVFVAGDNRYNTLFGLVPIADVVGIATPY